MPPPPPLHAPAWASGLLCFKAAGWALPDSPRRKAAWLERGKWQFRHLIRPRTRMEADSRVRPRGIVGGINTQVNPSRLTGPLAAGSRKAGPAAWNHIPQGGQGGEGGPLHLQPPPSSFPSPTTSAPGGWSWNYHFIPTVMY